MHSLRHAIAFAALIFLPAAFTAAQTPAARKKSSTAGAKRSGTARKAGVKKKGSTTPRQTWRTRQLQPTAQRYREIQAALVNKGYLRGEPSGAWSQESMDALRRFQEDQKLEATGKIDSLSLIALGLGPKRETAVASPPPQNTPPAAN
jgi:hypothetical protein